VAPGAAAAQNAAVIERERKDAAREAYAKGRRDEHARRRSHPVLALIVLVIAAVGAFIVYLAVREGSFTTAGQVVDQHLAAASQTAGQATQAAGSQAGAAIENAGQQLKKKGG